MPIYHLSLKTIKRSTGRSAIAAAAYRAAARLEDARTGLVHDYRRKGDVLAAGIELPDADGASWAADRQALWTAAEAAERRKDAQTAREFELALPCELDAEQNTALLRSFAGELVQEYGCAADWAIHAGSSGGDARNVHAHVLITTRQVVAGGLGDKIRLVQEQARLKREGQPLSAEQLRRIRARWAELANHALAGAGHELRIDHRSHAAREAGIIPTRHVGVHASAMQRKDMEITRQALEPEAAAENAARLRSEPGDILQLVAGGKSVFGEANIRRAVRLAVGADGKAMEEALAAVMASPELVRIASDAGPGAPPRFTTRRAVAMETALARSARALRQDGSHVLAGGAVAAALAACNRRMEEAGIAGGLSAEQEQALVHVTGEGGIALVAGAAGAGKSTMLEAAREAWQAAGRRVIGAALAGKAVDGLAEASGIESRTLSAWVHRWERGQERLEEGDVLVIDEAGMLGTAQLAAVLAETRQRGAKAVLVGDAEQLQAIGAGSPFRALAESCGAAPLSEIRRQRQDWQRGASVLFARHRTREALGVYGKEGAITWRDDAGGATAALAADYTAHVRDNPGQTRLALAHRRADVQALNEAIREGLQAIGRLGEGGTVLETAGGQRCITAGERIAFLKNDARLGVRNGSFGTVQAVDGTQLQLRLDGAGGAVIGFDAAEFADFDHGYATTVHKSQGSTVDRAFVLAGPTMDRHLTYVAMTRHRDAAGLYADRQAFTGQDGLADRLSRAGLQENVLDHEGFCHRRGIDAEAPTLAGTFLQFGAGAPAPAPPAPGEAGAARRARLLAAEMARIGAPALQKAQQQKEDEEYRAWLARLPQKLARLRDEGRYRGPDAPEALHIVSHPVFIPPVFLALARPSEEGVIDWAAMDDEAPHLVGRWMRALGRVTEPFFTPPGERQERVLMQAVEERRAAGLEVARAEPESLLLAQEQEKLDRLASRLQAQESRLALHRAVFNANLAEIDRLIEAGADLNARAGRYDETPLHRAIYGANPEVAARLIEAGADLGATDDMSNTPLHNAAADSANPDMAARLVRAGADLEARGAYGRTPLLMAAGSNTNPDMIARLAELGANPNARDEDEWTPLHDAARWNTNPDVITGLAAAGTDLNARDAKGRTSLHLAAAHNDNPEIITRLTDLHADLHARDNQGRTALAAALARGDTDTDTVAALAQALVGRRDEDDNTALHLAVWNANGGEVVCLLEAGAEVDARNKWGQTPLHWAARTGDAAEIARLVRAGAELDATDADGLTPLDVAAIEDHPEVAARLARLGADLNGGKFRGYASLHWAGGHASPEMITALIDAGADPGARDENDQTPLHKAARDNVPEVITRLARLGADLEARDENGLTPLHVAAIMNDNPDISARLVAEGADVNAVGNHGVTPLHAAAQPGRKPEVAARLLRLGADPEARTEHGERPLEVARRADNTEVIEVLEAATAVAAVAPPAPNARDEHGWTPLHDAAQAGDTTEIARLVAEGADPNAADKDGWMPLHWAATSNGPPATIRTLIELGADPNAGDGKGKTPLHWAAGRNRDPEAITALIEAGADPNAGDERGWTPLHMAANLNDDPAMIARLLHHGAELEARTVLDSTPLHVAARWGNPAVITALTQAGADPNARDNHGRTPLDLARPRDIPEVIEALEKALDPTDTGGLFGSTPDPQPDTASTPSM